jgi:L,D-peptidoglycan transpeptidase YkuD (ErfK/YbiS/YcfS/YnhG family)
MRGSAAISALLLVACSMSTTSDPLAGSRQAIVVLTENHDTTSGSLQRYERALGGAWRAVGGRVAVVVGRTGLAGIDAKHEGDGKSPSGVYSFGTAFGFAPAADFLVPYRQLRDTTECVDDTASRYYNQIVDRDAVPLVDWSSSEKMRAVSVYQWGIVVNYNTPAAPKRGSCIFMHIWSGPSSSTAGCTAMPQAELETILRWLDPAANPRLVQFTRSEYTAMHGLPALTSP